MLTRKFPLFFLSGGISLKDLVCPIKGALSEAVKRFLNFVLSDVIYQGRYLNINYCRDTMLDLEIGWKNCKLNLTKPAKLFW